MWDPLTTKSLHGHDCVRSNDDDGSAEHVAVLKMRHFALLEMRSDATEPLRCHDCVHSNDDGRGAEHVAVLLMRHVAVLEISSDATEPLRCHDCCTVTMTTVARSTLPCSK
jgi:hypothetical protein